MIKISAKKYCQILPKNLTICFAEILIILGVGTRPTIQGRLIYKWGQILMLSIFGISRCL